MKQFKNILLIAPLDKQIVNQASELLTGSEAKMTLMSIAPKLESAEIETESGDKINLQELIEKDLQSELESIAQPLQNDGLRVHTIVAGGDHAFVEVIRQVVQNNHDLVMMLADGVNSIREQLFGTLSMHLMRKCPCAVWVVKPSRRQRLRNIFAAVDPDPENEIRHCMNLDILDRALAIAQNHSAQLHVVHAWDTLGGELTRGRRWMTKSDIRLYEEKVAETHRKRLKTLLEANSDGTEIVHMLRGKPGTIIPTAIAEQRCDLLVMGTVCRTGIPGFFIGNTAETILTQVDCSVLTVKPKEFATPVGI